jgi:hypothetical protein
MNWFDYGKTKSITGNTLAFILFPVTVYFCYKLPIAFKIDGQDIIIFNHRNSKYDNRSVSRCVNLIKRRDTVKIVSKEEFDDLWQKQVQVHLDRVKM